MRTRRRVHCVAASALASGACLATVLAQAGAASAAETSPAPHEVFAGYTTSQHAPLAIGIEPTGRSAALLTAWIGPCGAAGSGSATFGIDVSHLSIGANGRIDATGKTEGNGSGTGAGNTATTNVHVTATFNGGTITGTFDDHVLISKGGQQIGTCDSGSIPFTATRSVGYGGESSQNLPVTAVLTPDKKKVKAFVVYWTANCTDPADPQFSMFTPSTDDPVKGGSFSDSGTLTQPYGSSEATVTLKMAGRLSGTNSMKGTFEASVALPSTGGAAASCHTGPLTWSIASRF